jgi:hypothetical protein
MSKARELLKKRKITLLLIKVSSVLTQKESIEIDGEIKELEEAIAELEAQEDKSCKDCTWWEENQDDDTSNPRWCSKGISEGYTTSITDEDFCCNKHNPKATK